jgi:hypothetical protein
MPVDGACLTGLIKVVMRVANSKAGGFPVRRTRPPQLLIAQRAVGHLRS